MLHVFHHFAETTLEDQENYFWGAEKLIKVLPENNIMFWPPGNYKLIDGYLCQILSMIPIHLKNVGEEIPEKETGVLMW